MHAKTALSFVVLLCAVLAIAGCAGTTNSSPTATPAAVETSATLSNTAAPVSSGNLVPSPTDVIAGSRTLNLNIEKDYLGRIIITFQGGNGNGHVTSFNVTIYRADGQVVSDKLGVNIGDVATLAGTKDTDRIVVSATMDDGKTYKIIDMISKFRTLG